MQEGVWPGGAKGMESRTSCHSLEAPVPTTANTHVWDPSACRGRGVGPKVMCFSTGSVGGSRPQSCLYILRFFTLASRWRVYVREEQRLLGFQVSQNLGRGLK